MSLIGVTENSYKRNEEVEKGANRQLDKLTNDYYNWRLETDPEWSTTLGVYKHNDKLESWDHRVFESHKNKAEGFLGLLTSIRRSELDKKHLASYDILEDILTTYIRGYKWRNFQPLNPFNFLEGVIIDPEQYVAETPFDTQGDFLNFIVRIEKMPHQYNEMMEDARLAMQYNRTFSIVSVNRIPNIIDALTANESSFPFMEPFLQHKADFVLGDALPTMTDRMRTAIKNLVLKLKAVRSFIQDEYMPMSRKAWGIHGWSNGKENYRDTLRWHTSLNITPEEVHLKGLDEVDRIYQEMLRVISRLRFAGTIREFFTALEGDKRFLMSDSEVALQRFRDIIFQRIMPELPKYFKNLPNFPIVVKKSPQDGIIGHYTRGTEDGTRPGTFYANVRRLEDIPTYMMVSLTLHETVPGHHLADSYSMVSDLPPFRKNMNGKNARAPFDFPYYSSHVEGWGLYAEYLGEEMGIYKDDYELMGRYSCEIVRACRLVVDTGLHYLCWDRDRALEYFLYYTGWTREAAVIEIDRYITSPGQACAYKMGEMKIKELRQKAVETLGYNAVELKKALSDVIDEGFEDILARHKKYYQSQLFSDTTTAYQAMADISLPELYQSQMS